MIKVRALLFFLFVGLSFVSAETVKPDFTVCIPMRDGKELPTDIYLPNPNARHSPCILVRSPAGRSAAPTLSNISLTKDGFVVAIQSTRSSNDAEGKTMPCLTDGWGELQDGYDTVEWLSASKFTNGKIGTMGTSALGIAQLMLAPAAPPSLKCQYIQFACGSIYHDAAYPGGQLHKNQIEGWLSYYAKDPSTIKRVKQEKFYGNFWKAFDSVSQASNVKVPALFYGGWYDTFIQGTIDSFLARQNRGGYGAKGQQKLVIGPWAHFWPHQTKIGDFDVPKNAWNPPYDTTAARWFSHYLKGDECYSIDCIPTVQYYVMGPFDGSPSKGNIWKTANVWPPKSEEAVLYLTSDQKLSEKKSSLEKKFSYLYDPENPCPTVGGRNLFIESGPKDQCQVEGRSDNLVFTSEPLSEDTEVTGKIKVKLFVETDAADTDFMVRLTDVYPDGRSLLITDSAKRLGHFFLGQVADKYHAEPHEIEVDLGSTSIVFAKGHKIRLAVTSSNYPRYEKNLNIKADAEKAAPKKAKNSLFVGYKYPSSLSLPVVK